MPPSSSTYQCLSCRLSRLVIPAKQRQFHNSTPKHARKSPYPSVKASELGLIPPVATRSKAVNSQPYTKQERQLLARKYTPEQMAIIDIGEEAIPSEDLAKQGLQRTDPMRVPYFDDFSTRRPIVDFPVEGEEVDDFVPQSALKVREAGGKSGHEKTESDASTLRLSQQTGLSAIEMSRLKVKPLITKRVVNQTRMGKIASFYTLTIAGNENGMLGVGEGKSSEMTDSLKQSQEASIRNMKPIMRYEDRSIFGNVQGKVGASVVELSARPPGFGNRCQPLIFEMARAAGIHDLAARTPRGRNKMNVVKAAMQALLSQRDPEDIASSRGRKMVDVRKVYYGGSVP